MNSVAGSAHPVSGAQALATGAIEAGVFMVTGYPGSPATAVINHILKMTSAEDVRVEWTSNEKVAIELAFGASLGGRRSLLCVKSVGLNVALDPLMVYNLSGCRAGLVILVGDDPEGWGSQNEQDSRILALAAELPLLEPTSVTDARVSVNEAFQLSEEMHLPVVVRFTRALAEAKEEMVAPAGGEARKLVQQVSEDQRPHSIVLPVDVVPLHRRLIENLHLVRTGFEQSALNCRLGGGSRGIIAVGFVLQKLIDALGRTIPPELALLGLGTPYPLPENLVASFMQNLDVVLVLEETAPVAEQAVQAAAQRAGLCLPVYGRLSGHVPVAGELLASHLTQAVQGLLPELTVAATTDERKPMPSRVPLCEGCPYTPTFTALLDVMRQMGGRDRFIVVGDPGCMVRSQVSMADLIDVKHGLGSSISMAAGIAASLANNGGSGHSRRVVALAGDSSFLHTGLNGLIDAARMGVQLLVIILDNGTVALTGGQPHPGTPRDARGQARPAVDLAVLAKAAGGEVVYAVDVNDGEQLRRAMRSGLQHAGVAVIIASGTCPPGAVKG